MPLTLAYNLERYDRIQIFFADKMVFMGARLLQILLKIRTLLQLIKEEIFFYIYLPYPIKFLMAVTNCTCVPIVKHHIAEWCL